MERGHPGTCIQSYLGLVTLLTVAAAFQHAVPANQIASCQNTAFITPFSAAGFRCRQHQHVASRDRTPTMVFGMSRSWRQRASKQRTQDGPDTACRTEAVPLGGEEVWIPEPSSPQRSRPGLLRVLRNSWKARTQSQWLNVLLAGFLLQTNILPAAHRSLRPLVEENLPYHLRSSTATQQETLSTSSAPSTGCRMAQRRRTTPPAEGGGGGSQWRGAGQEVVGPWLQHHDAQPDSEGGGVGVAERTEEQLEQRNGGVQAQVAQAGGAPTRQSTSFVAAAARAVSPAVCRIDIERIVADVEDSPFGGHDGGPNGMERGQGSGVLFDESGLVLTNAHVVAGADKVTITLKDGRKFLAEVKGYDDLTDLAVVKIDTNTPGIAAQGLPLAKLGDSSDLQVGDWVIAVGNPVGLDSTVTLGIVSSTKRSSQEVGVPARRVTFIQTDAAINPGNSGGPLVNEHGEVVGINCAIRLYAEGIGFAIPINKCKSIMYDLAEGKRIQHAYVGVQMSTVTPDFARQNNKDPNAATMIPEVDGAMVVVVHPKTPAADAGIRRFDVILEINGQRVLNAEQVQEMINSFRVGDSVSMKLLRGERVATVQVKAGDYGELLDTQKAQQRASAQRRGGPHTPGQGPRGFNGGQQPPRVFLLPPELFQQ